jgi:pimeloyl-ACP methyl ester carboxylesterase
VHTARAVLDVGGQRVSAADRVYLAQALPLLLVWGGADTVIPVSHAHELCALLPGSRLEVFEGAGHFPQVDDPGRFAAVVAEFVAATTAEVLTPAEREDRWAAAVRGATTMEDVTPSATPG